MVDAALLLPPLVLLALLVDAAVVTRSVPSMYKAAQAGRCNWRSTECSDRKRRMEPTRQASVLHEEAAWYRAAKRVLLARRALCHSVINSSHSTRVSL